MVLDCAIVSQSFQVQLLKTDFYVNRETRLKYGFKDGDGGPHTARTIMLHELDQLLLHSPADATWEDYRQKIVDENILGKKTQAARKNTRTRLRALYGLDPEIPLFRALRLLWNSDHESRPLLAFLCAAARDPLIRASSDVIFKAAVGNQVSKDEFAHEVSRNIPDRFSDVTLASISRNLASSWTQSGHLKGKVKKIRSRAVATPVNTCFALFLGYLEGTAGVFLFRSYWAKLLDVPENAVYELIQSAARRGLMIFKNIGTVMEIGFPDFLTDEEVALIHEPN